MAAQKYNARVRHKRDTSANWTTNNPVLLDGEIIIVDTDAGAMRTKTGDGIKTYTQLPFDDEAVRSLIYERVSISQGVEFAGMILGIDSDGFIVPMPSPWDDLTWGKLKGFMTWGSLLSNNT